MEYKYNDKITVNTFEEFYAAIKEGYTFENVQFEHKDQLYEFVKDKNDEISIYILAMCFNKGIGVSKDYKQSVYWYTKAAEEGHVGAQFNLGNCYFFGRGIEQNFEKAVYWWTKAAEQGNLEAQCILGVCYYNGDGVDKDYERASFWYTKSAEQGYEIAQFNLGNCYYFGEGIDKDYEIAFFWYTKSAEQGNLEAQCAVGDCYYFGEGVEQNYEKAVYWYKKAAEQGNLEAQCAVGDCYYLGEGVEQNYEKAVYWYKKAAEQGNLEAQCAVGDCYYFGKGVEQNYEKAVYWYIKAAEQGEAKAQYNLGISYYVGEGIEQNYEKAVYWYIKAAEQGEAKAQYNLGNSYHFSEGVEQNYEKAVYWWTKAAEQGEAKAQYNLGNSYHFGKGIEQNYEKAVYWWTKAAEQGLQQAIDKLKELELKKTITFGIRKDIFISWNHNDVEVKNQIVEYLNNSNIISCFESDGGCHGQVEKALKEAIDFSKMYLVLLTGNSIKSKWVQNEVTWILEKYKNNPKYGEIIKPVVINTYIDEEGKVHDFDVIKAINESENEVFIELISLGTLFDNNDLNKTLEHILTFAKEGLSRYKLIYYREQTLRSLEFFQTTLKNRVLNRNDFKGKTSVTLSYKSDFIERRITDFKHEYNFDYLLNQDSFLLSTAGCGKTLLFNKLIYDNYSENKFMIRIPLKDVSLIIEESSSLLDIIAHQFDTLFQIDEQEIKFSTLMLSKYLSDCKDKYIFIDGMNELPNGLKNKLIHLINQYKLQYDDTRFIYSSRDKNDFYLLNDVTLFELLPISLDETKKLYRSIASNFIKEVNDEFIKKEENFFNKLDSVDKDILGNPLLLSNLIVIYINTGEMPLKYYDIVQSALKVVFMETIESLSESIIENKHYIGESELYELLGFIAHNRINGSGKLLTQLIERFYLKKDKQNENNPHYYPRYKVGMGKEIYDYLSKQGIIQGENIAHDIYRDVLASRWYFYMVYTTLEYFDLEYLDFKTDGKEKLKMLLESSNSESEAWNNISLAFLTKLDDKVFELCSSTTLEPTNKSYPVFDETLSIVFSEKGFNKENIERIINLLNKEGFYYGEFIKQYIKE